MATEWVYIGTDVIKQARREHGWSYEAIARQIPVASKTWERWEKAGRIPVYHLDRVAGMLELEIERPARQPVLAAAGPATNPASDPILALREEVADLRKETEAAQETTQRLLGEVLEQLEHPRSA